MGPIEEEVEDALNGALDHSEQDGLYCESVDPSLAKKHRLDSSYLDAGHVGEYNAEHPDWRVAQAGTGAEIRALMRNLDSPGSLFAAALRLLGASVVAYHEHALPRKGRLLYYPTVLFTWWAAFEAFIRYQSSMLLHVTTHVPNAVQDFLREECREEKVDESGQLVRSTPRQRFRPVLTRYAALLRYGYAHNVDRGVSVWQKLEHAQKLRDSYIHLDMSEARALTTSDVFDALENVLFGIIQPSCVLGKTLMLGVYDVHHALCRLRPLAIEFSEEPFFKRLPLSTDDTSQFYCPFVDVDDQRFPTPKEHSRRSVARVRAKPNGDNAE